ncbi:MAG: DUF6531 domain-containing protein, partial [Acidobacteriota bacterium]
MGLTVYPPNTAPVVSAGADRVAVLPQNVLTLSGTASDEGLPIGLAISSAWTLVSGPGAAIASPASLSTLVTLSAAGHYVFRLTANDGSLSAFDDVVVDLLPQNTAPVVTAGPDQAVALPGITLAGSYSDDGAPPGSPVTVIWFQLSGPAAATIAQAQQLTTAVTLTASGAYRFRLTVNDGELSGFDEVEVILAPQNQAPLVNAGPDQSSNAGAAILSGAYYDDGRPAGGSLTTSWSQVSGPISASISSPGSLSTTVTLPIVGAYVFRLTVNDSELWASDDVAITRVAGTGNNPPAANAGVDRTVATLQTTLTATYADDGQPAPGPSFVLWTQTGGPASATIVEPASLSTVVQFTAEGTYAFKVQVSDGELAGEDSVTLLVDTHAIVNEPPTVNAGADVTLTLPALTATLSGSAIDDGIPGAGLQALWTLISGPGTATFASASSFLTGVTFSAPGSYILRLSVNDTQATGADDVVVNIQAAPPSGAAPQIVITSPADASAITAPTNFVGSILSSQLLDWRLEAREQQETVWRTISTGSTQIANDVIASFDPTQLLNGMYEVRIVARDNALRTTTVTQTAVVRDNLKVGQFSVSFVDVEVPLAGLPIRVTRTYDSRDKGKGDFGFGWRLDMSNVKLRENGQIATSFMGSVVPGFFPTYCLSPVRPQVVTITMPGGETLEFEPRLTPSCQPFAPIAVATVSYVPRPGTRTQGTLTPVGGSGVLISGVTGAVQIFDENTYGFFDPNEYLLTLPDGRELTIHQTTGLKKIKDLNGNVLTVTSSGIQHNSGKGVTFVRDPQGRITTVTDPAGNVQTYGYDSAGDLITHTDRETNATTFSYFAAPAHHLNEIHDPLGRTPIRNDYYPDGRIQRHTDAFGKTIEYAHDVAGRQEEVLDREGNLRVLHYDNRGNVTKEVQADGKQILRTFDTRNNRLSETEPHDPSNSTPPKSAWTYDTRDNVLSQEDALSNKTEYTYNARNQMLTTKDARGKTTTNAYDTRGNLTSTTDANGSVSTFVYDLKGNLLTQSQTVNGLVETTTSVYDSFGNPTSETNALGHVTTSTYDAQGNRKTEVRARTLPGGGSETLTTSYTYDRNGRLTRATDPDGTFTRTVYDAAGKQVETYDKLNRKTAYEYDLMGRLSKTTYADGTFDASTYDGEGRRLTSTDRDNHTTGYLYDGLGRLTKTTFADSTFTENVYDGAGRLSQTKDARGKTTTYEYDSAGRRTKAIDPLSHETVFTYDANGNQQTVKDANNHTTTYVYDDLNRRTRTIFPDATFTETTYDEAGRRTGERDQAGRVTQFRYDRLGRLTTVIASLSSAPGGEAISSYTYDELGNRLTQKDANNNITSFEYDKLGREIARILPDGAREEKSYDANGNLQTSKDFLGRVTTFGYDLNNRVTSRTAACASCAKADASWTYTLTGRRATATYQIPGATPATPETITETLAYDIRDRVTSVIASEGAPATQRSNLSFTYDANGNRESIEATIGGETFTTSYGYDDSSRLTSATSPAG